jgi:hypothetical protein
MGVLICILLSHAGHYLTTPSHIHPADVIVVHAGAHERVTYAVELYQQGLAPEIWITGLNTNAITGTTRASRQYAINAGVPTEAIHLLSTTNTWEDGREIAALAKQHQLSSLLIVTSWSHSRRALCNDHYHLRGSRITTFFAAPPYGQIHPDTWWQNRYGRRIVCSEYIKMVFYWLYYGLNPWTC